jgi:hypothetical protein
MLLVALSTGCSQVILTGSGNLVTQEEAISDFDKVDISQSFDVDVTQGEGFSVVVRVDDNLVEHLQVEKQGSTLRIGLKENRSYSISNATLQAEVTMPELTGLEVSGASDANITGFKSAEDLILDASGSSTIEGDIEAGDVTVDLSGSSEATLSGSGQDLNIDVSGSSDLDLSDFPVADVNIDASGSSTATVNASGRLDVDASGASNVFYLGDPSIGTIDTSGSSSVEAK